jgi:predicted nucleic acid-binding protein
VRVGLDTWFLYHLAKRQEDCLALLEREEEFIVSALTIFEMTRFSLQRGTPQLARELVQLCQTLTLTIPIDVPIAERAAHYAHGLGLGMGDAIILTTALLKDCEYFITGDSDFAIVEQQGLIKVRTPAQFLAEVSP